MAHATQEERIIKLDELAQQVGTAMLTSVDPNGRLYSRPMRLAGRLENGALHFFTYAGSDKMEEIHHDRQVNCAFACPKSSIYVSISGTAGVLRDRAKMQQLWTDDLKPWFPQGTDTPGICLIRVQASDAQYWESPGGTATHLLDRLRSAVTGKPEDPGEHQKVNL